MQITSKTTEKMVRRPIASLRFTARQGFSLLEVLLALAISVMLIAAISWAVHMYLHNLNKQQARLERAQVARGVIQMVSNDLRAAIQYKPSDVSGLQELMSSQSAAGLIAGLSQEQQDQLGDAGIDPGSLNSGSDGSGTTGGDTTGGSGTGSGSGAGGGIGGGSGTGGTGGMGAGGGTGAGGMSGGAVNPANNASAATPPERPGLYGTSTQIVIDISRLPRVDQYNPLVASSGSEMNALPSDIKTIGYFVAQQGSGNAEDGGLYRRSMDRAVATFSMNNGGSLDGANQLIAPEVIQLQFRYFDGEGWVDEWNSDEMGGFPSAVEFTIVIDPTRSYSDSGQSAAADLNDNVLVRHRSVVHLPLAEIIEDESGTDPAAGGVQ